MPGRDGRWRAPIAHSLQWMAWPWCTLGAFREMVMHPEKNHQDAWLWPHSAAEPFCLAESPPTAHWAHETLGEESYTCIEIWHVLSVDIDFMQSSEVTDHFFQVWIRQKASESNKRKPYLWQMKNKTFPSPCDTVSQSVPWFSLPNTKSNSDTEYGSEFQITCLVAIFLILHKCSFFSSFFLNTILGHSV